MNFSENHNLFSAIGVDQQITASIDLFYIGTFIGLAGGTLCGCIIVYYCVLLCIINIKKRKWS